MTPQPATKRNRMEVVLDRFTALPWAQITIVLLALRAIIPLGSRFWLDETVGFWITNGGWGELVSRCTTWPHSVLYAAIFLLVRQVPGATEWMYRLPSLLAIAGSAILLFRLVRARFGAEIAWTATAIFLAYDAIRFAAADARPYALGMFMVVLATDWLLRFLDDPTYKRAILYGAAAAGIVYFHMLFASALIFHATYFVYRWLSVRNIDWLKTAAAAATAGVLALPLAGQYLAASRDAAVHSFGEKANVTDVVVSYAPIGSLLVIVAALLAAGILMGKSGSMFRACQMPEVVFAGLWAVVPPLVIYVMSRVSGTGLMIARYYLPFVPGMAIVFAVVWAHIRPAAARQFGLCALAVFTLYSLRSPATLRHSAPLTGDWYTGMEFTERAAAPDGAPVLIRSQFPESDHWWPVSDVHQSPLFSPLLYRPSKAWLVPLPATLKQPQKEMLDKFVQERMGKRFFLVSYIAPVPTTPYIYYLLGRMGASGRVNKLADFDGFEVIEFSWSGGQDAAAARR